MIRVRKFYEIFFIKSFSINNNFPNQLRLQANLLLSKWRDELIWFRSREEINIFLEKYLKTYDFGRRSIIIRLYRTLVPDKLRVYFKSWSYELSFFYDPSFSYWLQRKSLQNNLLVVGFSDVDRLFLKFEFEKKNNFVVLTNRSIRDFLCLLECFRVISIKRKIRETNNLLLDLERSKKAEEKYLEAIKKCQRCLSI